MTRFDPRVLLLLALTGIGACSKHSAGQPPAANVATATQAAVEQIRWFKGNVDEAFARARAEGKPVLLLWSAEWCPPCHKLKAGIFRRHDFIEKTRLFIPVYLDGDDAGAQKAGEEFHVAGYPTVVIL